MGHQCNLLHDWLLGTVAGGGATSLRAGHTGLPEAGPVGDQDLSWELLSKELSAL